MSPTLFPLVLRLLAAEPSASDELTVQRVLNGGAALITKAAYPTATYERVEYGGTKLVPEGLAVSARFWFRSGWTGDRLYFDLDLVIGRDGSFKDLEPGDYSGIWPPFSAAIVTAAVLDDLNRSTGSGSSYSGGSSYTPRPSSSPAGSYTSPFTVEAVPLGEWRYGYALKKAQADLDAGKREVLAHAAAVVKVTDTYAYVIGPDGVVLPDVAGSTLVAYTTIEQPELQRLIGIYSFPTAAQRAALAAVQDCRARRRSFPC